jgi:Kef-type K+ transport system membrane component KefB
MGNAEKLLLDMLLIFAGAKLFGWLFDRLRQPAVVGEIVAGVMLGPSVFGLIHPNEAIQGLAEIGAIFLLFTIGFETKPSELVRVGRTAVSVAVLGLVIPFAFGFAYMRAVDHDLVNAMFLAAAMVATSVGITARVLKDANVLSTRAARVILAAAVVDDILGMIVLAVVTSLSKGNVNLVELGIVAAEAIGFSLFMIVLGSRLVGRLTPTMRRLRASNSAFILSVTLCLGLSLASVYVGMAAIIGAFLAGLALADHREEWGLEQSILPIYEFLGPFFFVVLGAEVNLRTFILPGMPAMLTVICILAVISKLLGCGLGAASLGFKDALRVGVGMIPRGEVGLIVAAAGLRLHVISDEVYTAVVLMSLVTTLIAPPFLRIVMPPQSRAPAVEPPPQQATVP